MSGFGPVEKLLVAAVEGMESIHGSKQYRCARRNRRRAASDSRHNCTEAFTAQTVGWCFTLSFPEQDDPAWPRDQGIDSEQAAKRVTGEEPVGTRAISLIHVRNQFACQERQEGICPAVTRRETVVALGGRGWRQVVRALSRITAGDPDHQHLWDAVVRSQKVDDCRRVAEMRLTVQQVQHGIPVRTVAISGGLRDEQGSRFLQRDGLQLNRVADHDRACLSLSPCVPLRCLRRPQKNQKSKKPLDYRGNPPNRNGANRLVTFKTILSLMPHRRGLGNWPVPCCVRREKQDYRGCRCCRPKVERYEPISLAILVAFFQHHRPIRIRVRGPATRPRIRGTAAGPNPARSRLRGFSRGCRVEGKARGNRC